MVIVVAWPPVLLSDLIGAFPRVWPLQDDVTARSSNNNNKVLP